MASLVWNVLGVGLAGIQMVWIGEADGDYDRDSTEGGKVEWMGRLRGGVRQRLRSGYG